MISFLIFLFIISLFFKILLQLIVKKYGKFSYDGFHAAGFIYDAKKDLFYTDHEAWQKNFGYTHAYDVFSPLFRMIIDTEPIKFKYNNKNWLITFWKGQYGIATGAEVGVYYTNSKEINKKTLYFPVSEKDMLDINITLYKNNQILASSHAKHWWLAIFKLGHFSKPKDLTMDVEIAFPNLEMLNAFLASFKKIGYKEKNYNVHNTTFSFKYTKPHTPKVWTRTWYTDFIRQLLNQHNVNLYNEYLKDLIENDQIDDSLTSKNKNLIMINDLIPRVTKNSKTKDQNLNQRTSKTNSNIILLNSNVYSEVKGKRI